MKGQEVDIQELVARLRATIEGARSMPMSSSAVINRTEVLSLIQQIEQTIPTAFAESHQVYSDREALLARGREEAERIVTEAGNERDRLVSDTEVYRVAKREAEAVLEHAEAEADALRRESDEYVDQRLANLEITLTRTLEAVTRGRDRLHDRSGLSQLDTSEHDESPFFSDPS